MPSLRFTAKEIRKLKPPKRRYYYDTHPESYGLALDVGAGGSHHTFFWRRRVNGRVRRVNMGSFPALAIDRARVRAKELSVAKADGVDLSGDARFDGSTTLGTVWAVYADRPDVQQLKSWRERETLWRLHLSPKLAGVPLKHIDRGRVTDLRSAIAATHSNRHANHIVWLLGHLMRYAIERGAALPDPTSNLRQLKTRPRDRWVGPGEVQVFLAAVEAHRHDSPVGVDAVLTALWTGQRQANILGMKWDQIDRLDATWRIPRTKAGGSHTVPLTSHALAVLKRREVDRGTEFVFPGRDGGHLDKPKRLWQSIRDLGPFDGLRYHDLRHTHASWLARTGAAYPVIAAMLGHAAQGMTARYTHVDMDTVREYAQKAADAMVAIATEGSDR